MAGKAFLVQCANNKQMMYIYRLPDLQALSAKAKGVAHRNRVHTCMLTRWLFAMTS